MLNHVELLGRLAQEPEIRYTQSGTPVASFDLAVQVPSKNKDAAPDYIPIVCWRERAEFCGRYLSKGRQIVVEGRIPSGQRPTPDRVQGKRTPQERAGNGGYHPRSPPAGESERRTNEARTQRGGAGMILQGDALEELRKLPDKCCSVCVTSPPYYNARDYGAADQLGTESSPEAAGSGSQK